MIIQVKLISQFLDKIMLVIIDYLYEVLNSSIPVVNRTYANSVASIAKKEGLNNEKKDNRDILDGQAIKQKQMAAPFIKTTVSSNFGK